MSATFCGKGFFSFLFEKKDDRDLIFHSGLYKRNVPQQMDYGFHPRKRNSISIPCLG
jgi:hypothetical protein